MAGELIEKETGAGYGKVGGMLVFEGVEVVEFDFGTVVGEGAGGAELEWEWLCRGHLGLVGVGIVVVVIVGCIRGSVESCGSGSRSGICICIGG